MHNFPFNKKNISLKKVAIITHNDEKITYYELLKKVNDLSKFLISKRTCLIKATNNFNTLLMYLACLQKKVIPILIDQNTKENNFDYIVKKFQPNYVFLKKENFSNPRYKKLNNNFLKNLFIEKKINKRKINKNIALLLSTSGSTGSIKFVKLSYSNIISNTINIIDYLKLTKNDITVTNLPMFYAYGLSIINTHIFAGGSLILTDKPIIDKSVIALLKNNPITNFNGVPFTYDIIFKFKLEQFYLSKLNFITQAGGKIKENCFYKLFDKLSLSNTKFYIMYGQTEASPRMSYFIVNKKLFINGIIGKAIQGGKLFLLDKKNKIISKPNEIGKLFYKGPNVFLGYAKGHQDLVKNNYVNRSLDTGDIAKFNGKKQFILLSRNSRFIKVEDKRINLDDIEERLNKEGIEAICTGDGNIKIWHTKKNLEELKIYEIIKENFSLTRRNIVINYIKDFPKNSAGKVLYNRFT